MHRSTIPCFVRIEIQHIFEASCPVIIILLQCHECTAAPPLAELHSIAVRARHVEDVEDQGRSCSSQEDLLPFSLLFGLYVNTAVKDGVDLKSGRVLKCSGVPEWGPHMG